MEWKTRLKKIFFVNKQKKNNIETNLRVFLKLNESECELPLSKAKHSTDTLQFEESPSPTTTTIQ